MRRHAAHLLTAFRSGAVTVGVSPKVLGALFAGGAVYALRQVGVLELSAQATSALTVACSTAAAVVLGPGQVAVPEPDPGPASDELLPPEVAAQLAAVPAGPPTIDPAQV